MRTSGTALYLLLLILPAILAVSTSTYHALLSSMYLSVQEKFSNVKVKVGRKTCLCSFSLDPDGSVKASYGSCDKKCSGSASGVELVGEGILYTFTFAVKKGKVAFKSIEVEASTSATPLTTRPSAGTPGSPPSSCPAGFRRVCSMLGSCTLGSVAVCPPGHQESGEAQPPSAADCRCVPFFLLGQLCDATTGAKAAETRSILDRAAEFQETVKSTKVKVGSKTCTCSFTFTVEGTKVSSSSASCDRKCSGKATALEVTGESGNTYSFSLAVKKGKAKITNPRVDLGKKKQYQLFLCNISLPQEKQQQPSHQRRPVQ